jgi:hypothetical protein
MENSKNSELENRESKNDVKTQKSKNEIINPFKEAKAEGDYFHTQ